MWKQASYQQVRYDCTARDIHVAKQHAEASLHAILVRHSTHATEFYKPRRIRPRTAKPPLRMRRPAPSYSRRGGQRVPRGDGDGAHGICLGGDEAERDDGTQPGCGQESDGPAFQQPRYDRVSYTAGATAGSVRSMADSPTAIEGIRRLRFGSTVRVHHVRGHRRSEPTLTARQ